MTFLSHSNPEIKLLDHLDDVANTAKSIVADSDFKGKDLVYYAGLFHDIGKLNPYYQKLFGKLKEEGLEDWSAEARKYKEYLAERYDNSHAPYSRYIAERALEGTLSYKDLLKVMMMVYCHHGNMTNTPGTWKGRQPENTKGELGENWKQFRDDPDVRKLFERSNLDFDIPSDESIKNSAKLKEESCLGYVELGFLHSALLQADRGCFQRLEEKNNPNADNQKARLNICTQNLIEESKVDKPTGTTESKLNEHRDRFQSLVAKEIKDSPITAKNPIKIINAPTGIGKTKAFLDMICEIDADRIFYFSPLLALTNDFESKMKIAACGKDDQEKRNELAKILTYNHVYSGSLDTKETRYENNSRVWDFDQESFNARFVITTMHRLLMTIYSPKSRDKLKLASFRNSLLIVDEVQTIPKFLLDNLMQIFQIMGDKMGTRTILVSATIPEQISESKFPTISMSKSDVENYLDKIKRSIVLEEKFDASLIKSGKNLVMLNTRKMAVNTFNEISSIRNNNDLYYISSGIVKKRQNEIIKETQQKVNSVLVSTQVMEAGVDISFSNVWRQMAPLDNIIQIAGRLNRKGEYSSSTLCIFGDDNHTPYSSLEYKVSKEFIKEAKTIKELYHILPKYYHEINTRNKTLEKDQKLLEESVNKLDFEHVWDMISKYIRNDYYDSVYIPDSAEWENIRSELLSNKKNAMKKYADIQAVLPISIYKIKEYFDEELFDKKIYYPKKDKIDELYDETIGLDKWIKT